MYVLLDFICKGILELWGTQVERILQNEKFLPTVEFELSIPRLRYETTALTIELRGLKSVERVKSLRALPVLFLDIYLLHVIYEAK